MVRVVERFFMCMCMCVVLAFVRGINRIYKGGVFVVFWFHLFDVEKGGEGGRFDVHGKYLYWHFYSVPEKEHHHQQHDRTRTGI